jgi:hypothetical protein
MIGRIARGPGMRRFLLVTRGGALLLPASMLDRLEPLDRLCPVPSAPRPVAGLGEAGGRIVTLLEPDAWTARSEDSAPPSPPVGGAPRPRCALRFLPPRDHLALLLEPTMQLVPWREGTDAAWPELSGEQLDEALARVSREEGAPA